MVRIEKSSIVVQSRRMENNQNYLLERIFFPLLLHLLRLFAAVDNTAAAGAVAPPASVAAATLASAAPAAVEKVIVNIRAGPGTPILKLEKFKVNAADQFATLVNFLKKQLQMKAHEPLARCH